MNKSKLISIIILVIVVILIIPFAVNYSIKQNHKVMLGQIFALAYEYKSDNKEWPEDLRFILKKYPNESIFVNSNWGKEYNEFKSVLVINPRDPDSIIYDKIWKMSVDKNGFVLEDE